MKSEKKSPKKNGCLVSIVVIFIILILIGSLGSNETSDPSSAPVDGSTSVASNNVENSEAESVEAESKAAVTVVDFSEMDDFAVTGWANDNNVVCNIEREYSDSIPALAFIRQEEPAGSSVYEGSEITVVFSMGKEPSLGEQNALDTASNYLSIMAFSRSGLIEQLKFEGYTDDEAEYAAANCFADWSVQAKLCAENYLDTMAFSYSGLIEQLEFEGFTTEQATFGVDSCGADWSEQAVKMAKSYLEFSSFSKQGLIEQLEFEGFSNAEAVYAVEQNGY